jgi:HEPN superfamily AbiU2-like protein
LANPTLKQTLEALRRQVLVGKSYFNLARGLLKADPYLLQTAPTFFGLTIDGSLELAQMAVARLYDKTKSAVTIRTMLYDAAQQLSTFQNATPTEAEQTIVESARRVIALQPILDAIRIRRNKWLAHLDPATVANTVAARATLTMPDLENAFRETEKIVVELFARHQGVFGELEFIGGDDYQMALDWIRSAKCTFIENYEKEFNKRWTEPRPKDCSNNLLKT